MSDSFELAPKTECTFLKMFLKELGNDIYKAEERKHQLHAIKFLFDKDEINTYIYAKLRIVHLVRNLIDELENNDKL